MRQAERPPPDVSHFMHDPSCYREQAECSARLARSQTRRDMAEQLERMARDYAELAEQRG